MQILGKARSIARNGIQFGVLRSTQGGISDIQTGRQCLPMQLQRGRSETGKSNDLCSSEDSSSEVLIVTKTQT